MEASLLLLTYNISPPPQFVGCRGFNLKAATGSEAFVFPSRLDSGARSREGQGEERQGSGARRRQEEIHHRGDQF